jgi:putative flippase GtrA
MTSSKIDHLRFIFPLLTRFFSTSIIATAFDYGLFLLLNWLFFEPLTAHGISYFLAVLLNYFLQRRFIFQNLRNPGTSFLLAMLFSLMGWGLSFLMLFLLLKIAIFQAVPVVAKLVVTLFMFFFNFFMKRYAFEGRLLESK